MHAKNQDRSPRKISRGFISVSRDFTPYFHFRCVARATFDRNLIHSADSCFLVMACVGYSRAQLKTLSSLLKPGHVDNAFATEELTPVLQSTFAQKKRKNDKRQTKSLFGTTRSCRHNFRFFSVSSSIFSQ